MKKIVSLVLAVLMLMALCVPAMAASETTETLWKGTNTGKYCTVSGNYEIYEVIEGPNSYYWTLGVHVTDKTLRLKSIDFYLDWNNSDRWDYYVWTDKGDQLDRKWMDNSWVGQVTNIHANDLVLTGDSTRYYPVIVKKMVIHYEPSGSASIFGEGSVWIIAAVCAVAVIGLAAAVISKKKKKEQDKAEK